MSQPASAPPVQSSCQAQTTASQSSPWRSRSSSSRCHRVGAPAASSRSRRSSSTRRCPAIAVTLVTRSGRWGAVSSATVAPSLWPIRCAGAAPRARSSWGRARRRRARRGRRRRQPRAATTRNRGGRRRGAVGRRRSRGRTRPRRRRAASSRRHAGGRPAAAGPAWASTWSMPRKIFGSGGSSLMSAFRWGLSMERPISHVEAKADDVAAFLCECGDSLCPSRVWLTPAGYERTAPAVAPGHERWRPAQPGRPCPRRQREPP